MAADNAYAAAYKPYNAYDYGTAHGKQWSRLSLLSRLVSWGLSFLVPLAIFAGIYRAFASPLRNSVPAVCWFLLALGFVLIALLVAAGVLVTTRRISTHPSRPSSWYIFLCVMSAVALVAGWQLGEKNFREHLEPFYAITNLNLYSGIDPAKARGQQLMDAGRVVFARGTTINVTMAANDTSAEGQTFCVAPITSTSMPLASYDFWAVGINCCSEASGFQCPDYDNALAHSAVRVMDTSNLANFKLAVISAEKKYGIAARHPVFFTWTEDPIVAVNDLLVGAGSSYLLHVLIFAMVQLFLTNIMALFLWKLCAGRTLMQEEV